MPVQNKIQFRRGTAAAGANQWTNQVLSAGEVGYETDTGRFKIGDGLTAWGSLEYAAVAASDFVAGSGVTLSSGTNGSTLTISSIINAGSGINVSESSGIYTISLSDPTVNAGDVVGLDEAIDDRVDALLVEGNGIQLSYNDNSDSLTIAVTGIALSNHNHSSSDITDFSEAVDDRVNDLLVAGSNVQLSYNDGSNSLTIAVTGVSLSGHTHTASNITDFNSSVSGLLPVKNVSAGSGISVSSNNGDFTVSLSDPTIQASDVTDFSEAVDDRVSNLLVAGTGVTISYNDSANTLTINSTITAGSGVSVSESGGVYTIGLSDPTIQTTDITDFVDGVNDRVADLIAAGSNIQVSYTDSGNDTSVLSIAVTGVSLSGHTHTLTDITDVTASATEVNYLDGSTPGTGVAGKAVVLDSNLNISNLGTVSTTGTLTVGGNLIVNGTTTTVNSTVTTIDDPILTLGGDTAPVSNDSKDRGIEFRHYDGSAKIGFFGYDNSTGKFTFIPDATNSSEAFSGTKGELDANVDWSNIISKPDPVISVDLTGEVTGSGNLTMTDLAGGTISINTTIAANSVALGTDTTGDYVSAVTVSGVGLSVTGSGENATYNISSNATSSNTASTIVARDSSGNFTASTITASGLTGVSANSPVTISYAVIDGGTP